MRKICFPCCIKREATRANDRHTCLQSVICGCRPSRGERGEEKFVSPLCFMPPRFFIMGNARCFPGGLTSRDIVSLIAREKVKDFLSETQLPLEGSGRRQQSFLRVSFTSRIYYFGLLTKKQIKENLKEVEKFYLPFDFVTQSTDY